MPTGDPPIPNCSQCRFLVFNPYHYTPTYGPPPRPPALCPVCNGTGQLPGGNTAQTAAPLMRFCHGCQGKGWV